MKVCWPGAALLGTYHVFFLPRPNGFSIMDTVAQATVYGRGKGLRDTLR